MIEEKQINTDILICGAGPAGVFLGIVLSHLGVKPLIIEKLDDPSLHTKAGTLQPRTMEILNEFGLADEMIKQGKAVYQNNFYSKLKKVSILDYSKIPTPYNYLLSISQPRIESVLLQELCKRGINIQRGVELVDLQKEGKTDYAIVRNLHTHKQTQINYKFLIATDGGRSKVRSILCHRNQVKLVKQTKYKTSFIMGDFCFKNYPFSENERHTFFDKKNVLVFVPMPDSVYRIVALRHGSEETNSNPTLADFQDTIQNVFGHKFEITSSEWLSGFSPSRFMVDSFINNNIILVGDAAHIISPIGAQGINLAIEDAYNLAWKLAMVMKGSLDLKTISSYHRERSSVATTILKQTHINQLLISSYVGNFILRQMIKTLKAPKSNLELALQHTLFNVRYEEYLHSSTKSKNKKNAICAGQKLSMAVVDDLDKGECQLFDLLPYGDFSLLINLHSSKLQDDESQELLKFGHSVGNLFNVIVAAKKGKPLASSQCRTIHIDENSDFGAKLCNSSAFLIVRPDKFIFADFHQNEKEIVIEKFSSIKLPQREVK